MPCFDSQADEYNKAAIRAACEMAKAIDAECDWLFDGLSKETIDWIEEHKKIDKMYKDVGMETKHD